MVYLYDEEHYGTLNVTLTGFILVDLIVEVDSRVNHI